MSVTVDSVGAAYTTTPVLHSVSLAIEPGQILSVLGPSGSGKSTLLRVIAGLHPLTSGSVHIAGTDVTSVPAHRRRIGLVPQDGALFAHRDVAGNIGFGIRQLSARHAAQHPRVRELIALVGLEGLEDRRPHELSGGQQQRVALARALAHDPQLVLLDEPFSALDAGLRVRLREEVGAILHGQGISTLLVTHDQEEALSMGDTVAVMREGRVVQTAMPATLYREPCDEWVARFIGDAVILPAVFDGNIAHCAVGSLPAPDARLGDDLVLIRPEQLRLGAHGTAAEVMHVRYFGHDVLVSMRLADTGVVVQARLAPHELLPVTGATVMVSVVGAAHPLRS